MKKRLNIAAVHAFLDSRPEPLPFSVARTDIAEGIAAVQKAGFVKFAGAEFNPSGVSRIEFSNPATGKVATIGYSERSARLEEPTLLIGVPGVEKKYTRLADFVRSQNEQTSSPAMEAEPKP